MALPDHHQLDNQLALAVGGGGFKVFHDLHLTPKSVASPAPYVNAQLAGLLIPGIPPI